MSRPPNTPWLTPYLTVASGRAAIDFYQRAFGFEAGQVEPGCDKPGAEVLGDGVGDRAAARDGGEHGGGGVAAGAFAGADGEHLGDVAVFASG